MTDYPPDAAWQDLARRVSLGAGDAEALLQDLRQRYSEPARAYHNLDHIAAVLGAVSLLTGRTDDRPALRLAVWFHDAVYDTHRTDNEERSADHAAAVLGAAGLSPTVLAAVERLILVTKTHQAPSDDTDAYLLLDADLAILGASREEYADYGRAIRAEYAWVPETDYRAGRRRVLAGFLERERLYQTEQAHEIWEQAARDNLRREIGLLTR